MVTPMTNKKCFLCIQFSALCLGWAVKVNCLLPLQEKRGAAGEGPSSSESSLFPSALRLSTSESYPIIQRSDNIFSHLPLHSQQARVPYLMIPIGGIQMVQARPNSHPTTPSSPTSPPLEGPSLARFEQYWGGTPRTQGFRTPGDNWSEHQAAGTSQPVQHSLSTALIRSTPEMETTDLKQYGSSHSSVHTHKSTAETNEHGARDCPTQAPSFSLAGQPAEQEALLSCSHPVEQEAKGDAARTDQCT